MSTIILFFKGVGMMIKNLFFDKGKLDPKG